MQLREVSWLALMASFLTAYSAASAAHDSADAGRPAPDTEVAVIGSKHVKFSELPAKVQDDLATTQHSYEAQVHALAVQYRRAQRAVIQGRANRFIDDQVLQMEAQARNTSSEQLIQDIKTPPITDEQVRAFYEQYRSQINQPFDATKDVIIQRLTQQATEQSKRTYLDGLRAKYAARLTLAPLREDVQASGPSRGSMNARVTIIEFSDFQCPFCAKMEPVLRQALDKYPGDVRLVYRHMPLTDMHSDAMHAAEASVCAAQQGKFWEMHDALFADQTALSIEHLKKTAATIGLKDEDFANCMDSDKTAATVNADAQAGIASSVDGTPGLFINGRYFSGAMSYEELVAVIDEELKRPANSSRAATTAAQVDAGRTAIRR